MNKRQQANAEILRQLTTANETLPDQRFTQLLVNAGITVTKGKDSSLDCIHYYEESEDTLKRLLDTLDDLYSKMLEVSDVNSEEV